MLNGKIGKLTIESKDIAQTHIKELKRFTVYVNNREVGLAFYFEGRGYYLPWLEIDYSPWLRKEGIEDEFFKFIYNFLPAGGKLFVTYVRDKETREMLLKGYSPVDTPLGFSLLKAGFTWFKDWYYPEGGNEGSPKLQANKPLSKDEEIRQLRQLLDEVKREYVRKFIESKLAQG
ncbi:DUF1122 family protein [Sulfurisphaera ohwakuensis]|uniref:DUF1122 family protein n=1 Tax=Sulfurisphaera ohwakuensis TaxID=69656 RepID=UPI0036F1AD8F